jgi:putative DNA methylase
MQRRLLYEDRVEESAAALGAPVTGDVRRAIEGSDFPFECLSDVAELESWRKEVHRPIYHLHKWWAQRLGSVFRGLILGTFAPSGADLLKLFYQPVRIPGVVVFDPFLGSGTTVGEALKLGCRAIGRDINPVAEFVVRTAVREYRRADVEETFRVLERDVSGQILRFYRAKLADGSLADVLYYFWVKVVPCLACHASVDLFSSYVFSQHAYASRNPEVARAVCPGCGEILQLRYDADQVECRGCGLAFDPQSGPARGTQATCGSCHQSFKIAAAVRALGHPPEHRLYAKMVLTAEGEKQYVRANDFDRELYELAAASLKGREAPYPVAQLEPGYNTNQALKYGYTHWHQMFNARQLLCLSILADRIGRIDAEAMRELFTCLFSGVLEFNNMFASFKGEGTGAVRHMFSHHILKPERTPLEANVWGTPKSSGSFSTLFESRVRRALAYREDPFEIRVPTRTGNGRAGSEKVRGLSVPLGHPVVSTFAEFTRDSAAVYLSCGDSARTDLGAESVDAVITDPPFFDNVHYSQLADFFYVWQRHVLGGQGSRGRETTRSLGEVQQTQASVFTDRLAGVWSECHRVLKPEGLLVFSYHHSRHEGWSCVLEALLRGGFVIEAAHPVKAEMSVAAPKQLAREPIDLDIILVCRKRAGEADGQPQVTQILAAAAVQASEQIGRLVGTGRSLSRNDVRVTLMAQVIRRLSGWSWSPELAHLVEGTQAAVEYAIDELHAAVSPRV